MGGHYQYNDTTFEKQFEDCSFPPKLFTHEAHLRLAWIHINKYGLEKAIEHLCSQIKRYDQFHDKGIKFHTTITVAAAKILNQYMQNTRILSFHELIKAHPELVTDFMGLINQHYSTELLNSNKTRDHFIPPDLGTF